jgi:hypothetical protein
LSLVVLPVSKVRPQYLAEFHRQMVRLVRAVRVQARQRRRPDSGRFDKLRDTAVPMLLSVAYDQVRKMAAHNELSRRTGIAVHFFDPSRPWQRDSSRTPTGWCACTAQGPRPPGLPPGADRYHCRSDQQAAQKSSGRTIPLAVYRGLLLSSPLHSIPRSTHLRVLHYRLESAETVPEEAWGMLKI